MSDVLVLLAARREVTPIWTPEMIRQWNTPGAIVEVASREQVLTAAEMLYPRVNSDSCNEEWVCSDGRRMKVGDMSHEHLVHALAKIIRDARTGYWWHLESSGPRIGGLARVRAPRAKGYL